MLNSVCLFGRLTSDPELKTFESGNKIAKFTVATQRNFKNKDGVYEADFINCQSSGKSSETIEKYFKKGQEIALWGELRVKKYTSDNGETRTFIFVDVKGITFVGKKSDRAAQGPATAVNNDFPELPGEDDLPF